MEENELDVSVIETLNVKQLKDELRKRHAPLSGRKAQLAERLIQYIGNNNFQLKVPVDLTVIQPNFNIPPDSSFKDVNASSSLPMITLAHITLFQQKFSVDNEMARSMYAQKFLSYIRHVYDVTSSCHFFKGIVHAQMYKHVSYSVNIRVSCDGLIEASHCECAAGDGGAAHCKHVVVVLLGLEEMCREGTYTKRQVCTDELQTFHKPKKSYKGTPLKASAFVKQAQKTNLFSFDPRPMKFRNISVRERIHNLVSPIQYDIPLKQLCPPANPYALEWDHCYSVLHPQIGFLRQLKLLDVSESDVKSIEAQTYGQHKNQAWHKHRSIRITASHFHSCCTVKSSEAAEALVNRLLNPTHVVNDALIHGSVNENNAVHAFMQRYNGVLREVECGLFIMKDRPYLGASPDRLLADATILEIKCPFTSRQNVITPESVPYLFVDDNEKLALRQDHPYFYQVQGQLAVTGRKFCEFIVFTFCDLKVISIKRDENFIKCLLNKLDNFYEQYFKPALLHKLYYRRYADIF